VSIEQWKHPSAIAKLTKDLYLANEALIRHLIGPGIPQHLKCRGSPVTVMDPINLTVSPFSNEPVNSPVTELVTGVKQHDAPYAPALTTGRSRAST
jgi:hypothetical protein